MVDSEFFEESTEQSRIKAQIVHDYFREWSRVMLGAQKRNNQDLEIMYMDLFAGPGVYQDGRESTPLLILKTAIQDLELSKYLYTIFNDKDLSSITSLSAAIQNLDSITLLQNQPTIHNFDVDMKTVETLRSQSLIPTLLFADPWGYKGLTLDLLNSVLKDWGCDCIFFFNYNRIYMSLFNRSVDEHMDALFGSERAKELRIQLTVLKPKDREKYTLSVIKEALQDSLGKYFFAFRFKGDTTIKTSHYLIFTTKNFKGFEIMKSVMGKYSSTHVHNVPSFEYNPRVVKHQILLDLLNPINELSDSLLVLFEKKTLPFKLIYRQHSGESRFLRANYQDALLRLEEKQKISCSPSDRRKYKGRKTLGDDVLISFP